MKDVTNLDSMKGEIDLEGIEEFLDITDELRSQTDKLVEKVDGLWECKKCSKTFLQKGLSRKHTKI